MRLFNALLVVVIVGLLASALPARELSPSERAQVALGLTAPRAKTCDCGGDAAKCTCGAECECPVCATNASKVGPVEWILYQRQYDRAVATGKPLLIWVGETCPACEKQWPQYLHARLSEFGGWPGHTFVESGPEVIVAQPDGLGGMAIVGRLQGVPTLNQVAALTEGRKNAGGQTTAGQTSSVPSLTLIPAPPPMPVFFGGGGFGGGMPMGGFGGGMPMGGGGGRGGC